MRVTDAEVSSATYPIKASAAERGPVQLATGGSCSSTIDTTKVRLSMDLPPEAKRFADAMLFTTRVDGEIWRPAKDMCEPVEMGRSWMGPGRDVVYGECDGRLGVDGKLPHMVQIDAVLPGTDVRFTGKPVRLEPFCKPAPKPAEPAPKKSGCGRCSLSHSVASPWPLAIVAFVLVGMYARRQGRTESRYVG